MQYLPVDQLIAEQVQSWVGKYDKHLKEYENQFKVRINPSWDFVALFGRIWVHLVELYELEQNVDERGEPKNNHSKSDC